MTEVMTTSETGGEKGKKPQRLSTLDARALLMLGEVSNMGSEKYAAYNFLRGYDWDLSIDAAFRHLLLFWEGQDLDDESGLPHVVHAAWHCLALFSFLDRELGTDTRFVAPIDSSNGEPTLLADIHEMLTLANRQEIHA